MSKAKLLNIEYKQDQGLVLQWKYTNVIEQQTYFRHILVLLTDQTDKANIFINKYVKRLKCGDLYNVYYSNRYRDVKSIGWKEKPLSDQAKVKKYFIKEDVLNTNRQRLLHTVEQAYDDFQEPVVVTFILNSESDREELQKIITTRRFHGKYGFIVGFFAPTEKISLSFAQKVSTFSTKTQHLQEQIHFYISNIYRAVLLYAKVTIQCGNGSINSMVDSSWRTTAFNQIERVYWGPNINYDKDTLFFYNKQMKETVQNITLRLEFMTLTKQKFICMKEFKVISSKAFYQKTFNLDPWQKPYFVTKNIELSQNPFSSFTTIKFKENTISKS